MKSPAGHRERRSPGRLALRATRRLAGWLAAFPAYRWVRQSFRARWPDGRTREGNRTWLLSDGAAYFPALFQALKKARRHIHVEMYMIAADTTGHRFADELLAAVARGVKVRLIYDAIGSLEAPAVFWARLRRGGVELLEYHPIAPWKPNWAWNRRNHRKLVVIDGRVAFVAGMNIADAYAPEEWGGDGWRDTAVRLIGPAVAELQVLFLRAWVKGGNPLRTTARSYFPPLSRSGRSRVLVRANTSLRRRHSIREALLDAINGARERIWITHAYFIPDGGLRRALLRAARRGVDVRIIIPANGDVPIAQAASLHGVTKLLHRRIAVSQRIGPVLHAKRVVIDDDWVLMGSYNMNYRSAFHDQEICLEISDRRLATALRKLFLEDEAASREISREVIAAWPRSQRLGQWLAWQFRFWC